MSNEARDIRIKETIATFEAITDELAHGYMINHPIALIIEIAVQLTPIVMSENGENARHGALTKTMHDLQNDLASRVDQIRSLFDSIAAHILDT